MRRTPLLLAASLAIAASLPAAAQDAVPNLPPYDHVQGGNVVPPGNTGFIDVLDLPAALQGTSVPENMTDQRDLYVEWGRKDWSFARPDEPLAEGADPRDALGEPYSPRSGVTIYRDGWGVPHIYGETDADGQFGVGYAVAEDRLFQADVFRHVARGEMAEFIGGQSWYDYDIAWRQEFYTDEELLAMRDEFIPPEQQELLQAYADGINAYIDETLLDPTKLPAEYPVLGLVPEPWQIVDSLSVSVLQSRDSVEGFGQELYNTALLEHLRDNLGDEAALEVFDDVRFYRDPGTYTTAPVASGEFPYPGGGFEGIDAPGAVVPDSGSQGTLQVLARDARITDALELVGLARHHASNAIPVGGRITADGRPILLGGPQLDYLVPGIFYEFEVNTPTQHVRGIGFAGTAGIVLIGKTPTHAWSISYGYTDQIDVFLVPLDPADPENSYLRDGASHPLQTYDSVVTCKLDQVTFLTAQDTSALCDGLPLGQTTVRVVRVPEYGPVIGTVEVGGAPHAVVKVRAHWMREIQNALPFVTFNQATTIDQFRAAQEDFNISINLHYVDDQGHYGFWHVARPPIRAQGTDVRMPTIGNGDYDWQGFVPLDDIPHAIDPEQGFTANWNNQVGAGWHNGDQNSWADHQRVDMLARRMEALAARGGVTPEEVWQVNHDASFEDARWAAVGQDILAMLAADPPTGMGADALAILEAWDGQRTASLDGETWRYDDPAVAIIDRMWLELERTLLQDELGEDYATLSPEFSRAFYNLYDALLIRILRGEDAPLVAEHDWLDGVSADQAVRDAFTAAIDGLSADSGTPPAEWLADAVLTTYRAVGVGSADAHPFMNRGTYNQLAVVDVAGAGPQPGPAPVPTPTAPPAPAPGPAPGPLPTTGGGLALLGIGLLAAAARTRRRIS